MGWQAGVGGTLRCDAMPPLSTNTKRSPPKNQEEKKQLTEKRCGSKKKNSKILPEEGEGPAHHTTPHPPCIPPKKTNSVLVCSKG